MSTWNLGSKSKVSKLDAYHVMEDEKFKRRDNVQVILFFGLDVANGIAEENRVVQSVAGRIG